MKRIYRCLFLTLMLNLGLTFPAVSEPLYTLKELCSLANQNAETIQIAQENLYIAEQDKERARSVLIPRATLYGRYLNYKNADQMSPDTNTLGGKLTQSFTLNGRELIAYDVSKKGIEKAQFSKEAVRSDYIFTVAQSYIRTLSNKRLVEVADAEVERLTAYRNSVKEKLTVGNVTKTALYRAEAELSRAKTDHIVAVNNVDAAKANIVRLVGVEEGFRVSAEDVVNADDFSITRQEIEASAKKNRYEIKEAQKAIEIAHRTVSYEKGDYWPSLDLEGGYNENDIQYKGSSADTKYDTENAYIQAQLTFTLYDGGLRGAQVRQALARERQARQALADQKKVIVLQSTESYLEFEAAKNTLINLEDELKSAQENYNAVQMQFKYGMADSIDIMDANSLLVGAQRRISNAEYTYYLAILKIIYTQGNILTHLLADSGK
ncbi:MAG: TolC family protein [Desulfobacter sp.]|nr:TolC family protein [Desulfobacter sp.]WDP86346.1 MAG: TolC family protein [Desulfobacter sp.]